MLSKLPEKITIELVEEEVKDIYLIVDEGVIRVILATVIGNRMSLGDKPIWLLLCAGSSTGKSALLQMLEKTGSWIHLIDTLTTNTFASGFKANDKENSLLHKANNGVLVFKDFTTILSMNQDGLKEIMGQLRGIYDGTFDKKTGNNSDVVWNGKIGIIGGGTIAIQRKLREFSENGERFINYIFKVPDAKAMTKKALKNQGNLKQKEAYLANLIGAFINQKLQEARKLDYSIPENIEDEIIDIADFCTMARSPVIMNKHDPEVVEFVPDREMPPRMAMMLKNMAVAMMHMSGESELSYTNAKILYKIALDSIPVERRLLLRLLASYRCATTRSIAIKLNLTTNTVRAWLAQLDALKMVKRIEGSKYDIWELKGEFKVVMQRMDEVTWLDMDLEDDDGYDERPNVYTGSLDKDADEEILRQVFESF